MTRSRFAPLLALFLAYPGCGTSSSPSPGEVADDDSAQADGTGDGSSSEDGQDDSSGDGLDSPDDGESGGDDGSSSADDGADDDGSGGGGSGDGAEGLDGGVSSSDAGASGGGDGSSDPGGGGGGGTGTCPTSLLGWATVSGSGVASTTGGGNAAPVRVRSADELVDLAGDDQPRVLELEGTFDVPSLTVNSNKTLRGVGAGATLRGALRIRGRAESPVSNIVVQNLTVNGATSSIDDAVQIQFAHHLWLDHLDIFDGPDGNLDMTHAVDLVTVSWTRFHYTSNYQRPEGEAADHRFSSLIGHSDNNAAEDTGKLRITFHHNHWAEGVIERMPRVRFGQVHVYDNYFSSEGNNYCVRAGRGARLLIEANYFDHVKSPHQFNSDADEATAFIVARDNVYDGTSGEQAVNGGGARFDSVPYDAQVEPAEGVPEVVTGCAGPR